MLKLKIFLRQACGRLAYNISPVVDDEALENMYDLWRETDPYIAEMYIEKKEIGPIPSTHNVGPMMSLFNACMDQMRVHRPSYTAVPETASASHHTLRDICGEQLGSQAVAGDLGYFGMQNAIYQNIHSPQFHGLDSISTFSEPTSLYQQSPRAYQSNPGPSCRVSVHEDVYTSTGTTIPTSDHEADREVDVQDAKDSNPEDVPLSDSEDEIGACGFQHDFGHKTVVADNFGPSNKQSGGTGQNIHAGQSYVPRVLACFTTLGTDDADDLGDDKDQTSIPMYSEENMNICLHMRFVSKQQLVKAIRMWSIDQNREFRVVESKRDTWVVRCKSWCGGTSTEECDWSIRALRKKTHGLWQLLDGLGITLVSVHCQVRGLC